MDVRATFPPSASQLLCVGADAAICDGLRALGSRVHADPTPDAELAEIPCDALLVGRGALRSLSAASLLAFRRGHPNAPALMLTTEEPEDSQRQVFALGLDAALAQNDPVRLHAAVQAAIESRGRLAQRCDTVLLAAPQDSSFHGLAPYLVDQGLQVLSCHTETELLTRLRETPVEALLVAQPLEDCLRAIRRGRRFDPRLPALLLSELEAAPACLQSGMLHGWDFCVWPQGCHALCQFLARARVLREKKDAEADAKALLLWLVDASAGTRTQVRAWLAEAGHSDWQLVAAPAGAWPPPDLDAVLLDVQTPASLQELLRLHQLRPGLPLVALAGEQSLVSAIACSSAGASAVLRRDGLGAEQLCGAVLRAIGQRHQRTASALRHGQERLSEQLETRMAALRSTASDLQGLTVQARTLRRRLDTAQENLERDNQNQQRLLEAAVSIGGAVSLNEMLQRAAEHARSLVGIHAVLVSLVEDADWTKAQHGLAISEEFAFLRKTPQFPSGAEPEGIVFDDQLTLRLSSAELQRRPPSARPWLARALKGAWFAQPLTTNLGKRVGLIQFARPFSGIFDEECIKTAQRFVEILLPQLELRCTLDRLRSVSERLRRANEDLESFVYGASHDMKSPLRAIANLAEWIAEDIAEGKTEDVAENLSLMRARIQRMARLLDDLLDYSRVGRQPLHTEIVSGARLLANITGMLDAPKAMQVVVEGALPTFETARGPLLQVLLNLIQNAVKHHDRPAGCVTVACRDGEPGFYEFSVSDDGPGIPQEFQEKVFQLFKTLRSRDRTEGSGMGLAFVRRILQQCGGQISVHSGPGRGTCFRFQWPKDWQGTR